MSSIGQIFGAPGPAQKTHSTQTPMWPSWLQPGFTQAYGLAQGLYAPGGQLAPYNPQTNLQVAGFTPDQLSAMQQILGQTGGAQGIAGLGGQNISDVLAGKFLNPETDPYLQATYEQAAQGLTNQYTQATAPSLMAAAQRAGAFGGGAYNQANQLQQYGLGQNLANLGTDIFGGAYEQGRQQQMQALGLLPSVLGAQFQPGQEALGIGTIQQQQQQLANQIAQQNALQQTQWPFQVLQNYEAALQGLSPGPTVTGYQRQREYPYG